MVTTPSIIYIGDGMHLCNLLNTAEFESLINEMRELRTSVSSLAIGPKTDCELLSTISNHTGGKIFVRQGITAATSQQIGDALAKVALEPVFWPAKSNWPTGVASYFPVQMPPLRFDRDSILVGNLKADSVEGSLEVEGIIGFQSLHLWSSLLQSMAHVGQVGTFILPLRRGQGVGHLLWNATQSFANQNGYRKLAIQVRATN